MPNWCWRTESPEKRLSLTANGQIRYQLKTPYRDGTTHVVFSWGGRRYRSLSRIARQITGTNWNGFLFFGLTRPTEPETEA